MDILGTIGFVLICLPQHDISCMMLCVLCGFSLHFLRCSGESYILKISGKSNNTAVSISNIGGIYRLKAGQKL